MGDSSEEGRPKSLLYWLLLPVVMVSGYALCGIVVAGVLGSVMGAAVAFSDSVVQIISILVAVVVGSLVLYFRLPKATRIEFWKDLRRP